MEERLRFVARLLEGEAMTDVCRDFGISRKTGYKVFDRYREHGLTALRASARGARHEVSRIAPPPNWPDRAPAAAARLGRVRGIWVCTRPIFPALAERARFASPGAVKIKAHGARAAARPAQPRFEPREGEGSAARPHQRLHVAHGLDDDDIAQFKQEVSIPHSWTKVVIVDPHQPARFFEL